MARNRQRARDRKAREGQPHDQIHRENIPSELDNLGQEDVFEASIISGADGEPTDVDEAELEREAVGAAPPAATPPARTEAARTPSGPRPGGNRVTNFLRASWAELQRVQWPDRRQVAQATAVVLGFVAIAGAYLGLADAVAQRIVDFIL
jgi:preprotein translocase subunit SecE